MEIQKSLLLKGTLNVVGQRTNCVRSTILTPLYGQCMLLDTCKGTS